MSSTAGQGQATTFGIVPNLNQASGGIYQYSLLMLQAFQGIEMGQPVVLFTSNPDTKIPSWAATSMKVAPLLEETWRIRAIRQLKTAVGTRLYDLARAKSTRSRSILRNPDQINPRPAVSRHIRNLGVDFMVYPAPTLIAFETDLPFAMAIHDLHHRITPQFPEVGNEEEWTRREYLFRNTAREASIIWSESEAGKKDILRFYGDLIDDPDRVKVLPLIPAPYLETPTPQQVRAARLRYDLPNNYLFYPAQFWPHKNHQRLVAAVALAEKEHGLRLHLVLTGGGKNALRDRTRREVMHSVETLGLLDRVHVLGFISDEDMAALYASATALVMPTFFGPTNIPIVEAWALECPVVASRLSGAAEQIGQAALLVDPNSEEEIAQAIVAVATDPELAQQLVRHGTARLSRFTFEGFAAKVDDSLAWATRNIRPRTILADPPTPGERPPRSCS